MPKCVYYSCANLRSVATFAFCPLTLGRQIPQLVEMWSVCSFPLSARLLGVIDLNPSEHQFMSVAVGGESVVLSAPEAS